ncbi:hypothetical protein Ciccas_014582 [Cichlidogyrus casuarinus]|uniref:Uncharacterized protein n=1 Tax=Cichlidogyrus casuarinus TaxID=1844966 RepID=A0ABD2PHZ6_9PLAT
MMKSIFASLFVVVALVLVAGLNSVAEAKSIGYYGSGYYHGGYGYPHANGYYQNYGYGYPHYGYHLGKGFY